VSHVTWEKWALIVVLVVVEPIRADETHEENSDDYLPYVQRFKWAAEQYSQVVSFEKTIPGLSVKKLIIQPAEIRSHAILGACVAKRNEIPRIAINQSEWRALSESAREQLIFHELGHCALSRAHDDSIVQNGPRQIPRSIMASTAITDAVYKNFRDYYYSELFYGAISR